MLFYVLVGYRNLLERLGHKVTAKMAFKCADDISQLLRDRILELLRFGLNNLWFLLRGEDGYAFEKSLNYSVEDYLLCLEFCGFIDPGGGIWADK